jgi:hypothetical protein
MNMQTLSLNLSENWEETLSCGSDLMAHIAATLLQAVDGRDRSGVFTAAQDRFVYYAGHDVNLVYLRRLLRLSWLTESWNPNQAMPGGTLLLELRSSQPTAGPKAYAVKLFFASASYDQVHNTQHVTWSSLSATATRNRQPCHQASLHGCSGARGRRPGSWPGT